MAVAYIFLGATVGWIVAITIAILGGTFVEVLIYYFASGFATFAVCVVILLVSQPSVRKEWSETIQALLSR